MATKTAPSKTPEAALKAPTAKLPEAAPKAKASAGKASKAKATPKAVDAPPAAAAQPAKVDGAASDEVRGVKRKRTYSFAPSSKKILRRMYADMFLHKDAAAVIHSLAAALTMRLCRETAALTVKKTLTSADLQRVTNMLLPADLAKHATSCATKANTQYLVSKSTPIAPDESNKPVSKAKRANLDLSPALALHYMKEVTTSRLGETAGVYLAAVVEYIIAEVLEAAAKEASAAKFKGIFTRHIYLSIANDGDMSTLFFHTLKVVIPNGGVVPQVHQALLEKTRRTTTNRKPKEGETKLKHRFRPGTVALRNITKMQRSTDLELRCAPFVRVLRKLCAAYSEVRFSQSSTRVLQSLAESMIVKWLQGANLMALHAKRKKVITDDVRAYLAVMNEGIIATPASEPLPIGIAGLRRLSYRAGVKSISDTTLVELTKYLHQAMSNNMKAIVQLLSRDKKRTVTVEHVKQALGVVGVQIAV